MSVNYIFNVLLIHLRTICLFIHVLCVLPGSGINKVHSLS